MLSHTDKLGFPNLKLEVFHRVSVPQVASQIKTDSLHCRESVESESNEREFSALNELEATSCFLATVLLSFLNSRVSRHITFGSEILLEILIDGDKRS